jgi:hypothetical protein
VTASGDSISNLSDKANRRAHPPKLKIHCIHPWWLTSGCIKRGDKTSKKLIFSTIQGMAGEADNPLGDLFVSLVPTIAEACEWGGRYQYQQVVISNLIEEFGIEINILLQLPPRARFQLNSGTTPFPRLRTSPDVGPALARESRPLSLCFHLGYVSNFLIVRGVHQYLTGPYIHRKYRHQWTESSSVVATFETRITGQGDLTKRPQE